MVDFCREHGIHLFCYGTIAGGFLSNKWLGQPDPPQPYANRSLVKYRLMVEEFGGWERFQELLRQLDAIAASTAPASRDRGPLGAGQAAGGARPGRRQGRASTWPRRWTSAASKLDDADRKALDELAASAPGRPAIATPWSATRTASTSASCR